MNYKTLAKNLKSAVESIYKEDGTTTYKFALDENFAVYVGWEDGFDENDEYAIHSKSQPTFCICVKVAENIPSWGDMGDAYMPWYTDDEEVYDTDTSISPNADYNEIAEYLLNDWREMKKLLKKGKITF